MMKYQVFSSSFRLDKNPNAMFATNDKQEAVTVAEDIGPGSMVLRLDESGLKEIIYTAPYKLDLGLFE
jgi:hypothetical protein